MEINNIRIQTRIDTTENWNSNNPVLLDGEIGIEKLVDGTKKIKIGNGTDNWNSLSYSLDTEGIYLPLSGGTLDDNATVIMKDTTSRAVLMGSEIRLSDTENYLNEVAIHNNEIVVTDNDTGDKKKKSHKKHEKKNKGKSKEDKKLKKKDKKNKKDKGEIK